MLFQGHKENHCNVKKAEIHSWEEWMLDNHLLMKPSSHFWEFLKAYRRSTSSISSVVGDRNDQDY